MPRRYRERARTHSVADIVTRPNYLMWYLKKEQGYQTRDHNERVAKAKRDQAHRQLTRRVYQTGEWWLFTDPYAREQAKAFFNRGNWQ